MTDDRSNVKNIATYGLVYEGILQMTYAGTPSSRAFRMDCPVHKAPICVADPREDCPYLEGIRRNRSAKKYWILCNCLQRKA